MIVAIHSSLYPTILYPWLRLAVPLFFMISSYLFFVKVKDLPRTQADERLKKYVRRNLSYYLFWFIVLLPLTAIARYIQWYNGDLLSFIWQILTGALFSSTFIASWFITACVTSVCILYAIPKKHKKAVGIVVFLIYLLCCIRSSYFYTVSGIPGIRTFIHYYEWIFTSPVNSFPAALLWVYTGKCIAEGPEKRIRPLLPAAACILCAILLRSEWAYVYRITGACDNDCYFSLIPAALILFLLIRNCNITLKNAGLLRTISSVTYPLHGSLAYGMSYVFKTFFHYENPLLIFIVCIVTCHIVTFLILKLEKHEKLAFLRFSH